jgi:ARG/rhodanese/phosphatase superfamily protein
MQKPGLWGTFLGLPVLLFATAGLLAAGPQTTTIAGQYKLLEPISHGDLTIFPVVTSKSSDTSGFITLDEGIRSGEVVVTEVGNLHGMMRRRPYTQNYARGAEVNRLVLVNNSKMPLILLAGEIVTGGKQDRVISKDRLVPPESDPLDLTVFCVEPGRWVESSTKFDTHASVMAQPSVRKKAMVDANQQKVWDEVATARAGMVAKLAVEPSVSVTGGGGGSAGGVMGSPRALHELQATSSYAKAIENSAVKQQMESITEPMQKSYESVIKQLRNQNAVGVVVAVKGRIVWADIFASNALLTKYWPKLLQSYAAESLTASGPRGEAGMKEAERFLADWEARHETVDSEPGLYRQRELTGSNFRAFELTSLLTKAQFDVHLSKMAD